jgi:ribonuclease P protein component
MCARRAVSGLQSGQVQTHTQGAAEVTALFPRGSRILKRATFTRVYEQGRRQFSPLMTFFYVLGNAADEKAAAQVGITVSRALGTAVIRNRIKRKVRDAVRKNLPALNAALRERAVAAEIVINPKRGMQEIDQARVLGEVKKGFAVIAAANLVTKPAHAAGPATSATSEA